MMKLTENKMVKETNLTDRQKTFLKEARLAICSAQGDMFGVNKTEGKIMDREIYDKLEKINSDIEHLLGYWNAQSSTDDW